MIKGNESPLIKKMGIISFSLVILFLILFININQTKQERWHSIIINSLTDIDSIETMLHKKGMMFISSSRLPVLYSNFTDLNEIPLNQLDGRLLEKDRRYDPCLRKLKNLYITDQGERLFFMSNNSLFEQFFVLNSEKESFLWEQKPQPIIFIGPLVYLFHGLTIVFYFKKSCLLPFLLYLSWIPYIFYSHYHMGLLVSPIILLYITLLDRKTSYTYIGPLIITLCLIGYIFYRDHQNILIVTQMTLSLILAFLLRYISPANHRKNRLSGSSYLKKTREHPLFEPIYFIKSSYDRTSGSGQGSSSFFLLIPFTLILLFPLPVERVFVPEFPQVGEITKHLDYQQEILYRKNWDSPVQVNDYIWENQSGKILEVPSEKSSKSERNLTRNSGYAYSFLLNHSFNKEAFGFSAEQYFYKYSIFSIILLFFLYKVLFLSIKKEGMDKLFFISNRRGRKVA